MQFVRRLSVVVRLFDLRLSSNRLVLAVFVAAFVTATALGVAAGESVSAAGAHGLQAGFTVLLSWALARELDPDRPISAAVAIVVGLLIALTGDGRLAVVTALLFAARVVVRSAGAPPTIVDLVWLFGLCAFSASSPGGWIGGAALGVAIAWDARLPRPAPVRSLIVGAAGITMAGAIAFVEGNALPGWKTPTVAQGLALSGGIVGAVALFALRKERISSTEDRSDQVISMERLNRARGLIVSAAAVSFLVLGGPGATAFVGVWAALIGVGLITLYFLRAPDPQAAV